MLNIQLDKSRVEKLITKAKPGARIEQSVKEEPLQIKQMDSGKRTSKFNLLSYIF